MANTGLHPAPGASFFPPSRRAVGRLFAIWAVIGVATALAMYAANFAGAGGIMIGGDFAAFFAAAKAAAAGEAARIYDPAYFHALLRTLFEGRDDLNLSWQYPPPYLLLILPFSAAPYFAGYAFWSGATAIGYAYSVRPHIRDRLVYFAVLASPAAYVAFITGQNGFFSAALLAAAAMNAKNRPIVAGVAAGLLTLKPHLALLLPIAFLGGQCWRAALAAAAASLALGAASLVAFGVASWAAFFDAVFAVSTGMKTAMPLVKMATPYSAVLFVGASPAVAAFVQGLCFLGSAVIVWIVWRRTENARLRALILIPCVFIASPYGFYYELIILGLPVALAAMGAAKTRWLSWERQMIAAVCVLPICVTFLPELRFGVSAGFLTVAIACALSARRIAHEAPEIFSWRRARR
jgi:hypothetical protein